MLTNARRYVDHLAAIVDSSDDAIISKTLDGTILSWNRAAERMYGYTAGEAIGASVSMIIPPECSDELASILDQLRRGDRVEHLETQRLHKNGTRVDVSVTVSPIVDGRGAVVGASSIARDRAGQKRIDAAVRGSERDNRERVRAVDALRRSEESYRRLFERHHPSPMWLFDPATLGFLGVNDAAVASYGYSREEFLAMTIDDIRPAEDVVRLHATVGALEGHSRIDSGIWRHCTKDGTLIEASVSSSLVEFEDRPARLVLAVDVTEQRRLEDRLLHSQKMEAIGTLAGGVAHDFNNVLMVVRASAALLLRSLSDPTLRADTLQIDAAAERGAELTRQLLAFSRQQVLHLEPSDVNDVVEDTLALLDKVIGEDIETIPDLEQGLPSIVVDRAQLGQVILNLAVNARDAMPAGGTLRIRTAAVDLQISPVGHPEVPPGQYVLVEVADSGAGMDEETKARAFDPFFTTKQTGTGLGLATVYGIVTQSGGHIWLQSERAVGTTFTLYFPSVLTPVVAAPPEPPAEVASLEGGETILLVEDNDLVRRLVADTLRFYGYDVHEASGGADALEIAEGLPAGIDLLFTDIVMLGMNGRELAGRLLAERPELRVLYTSGYPADTFVRQEIAEGRAGYIEKPYAPDELATRIRQMLLRPVAV